MHEFSYVARDSSGQKVTGSMAAASRAEVLSALAAQSLFPTDVQKSKGAITARGVRRVPAQLMAVTFGQLADLLRSGVPLLRALDVLQRQTSHSGLREVLSQVRDQVEDGSTLGEAMARFERLFGEMAISMVRAGGEGGFLEEALARVAEFTEAQDDLKKRTQGAVAYPMFLAVVGVVVVTVLVLFFVPKFEDLFGRLRERNQLPAITDWLLWLSNLPWQWSFWIPWGVTVATASVVGGFFGARWLGTAEGHLWRDQMKLRIPVAGKIFLNLAVARFCRVLGTMLSNGVPILKALHISSDAAGNRVLSQAIHKATETISAGERLATPLAACGHFPPTVVEMISVAEESNNLEAVLLDIADSLERRTWRQLDLAVRLLEPIMLLLIAGMVLIVVVGLLLPMFKLSQTI